MLMTRFISAVVSVALLVFSMSSSYAAEGTHQGYPRGNFVAKVFLPSFRVDTPEVFAARNSGVGTGWQIGNR